MWALAQPVQRMRQWLAVGACALFTALGVQVPAQAQNVNASLREAVSLIPIPGIKDAVLQLFAALKPIPGANGYTAKTAIGGTPVMLYVYGDGNRQAILLGINGTIAMPGVFNNSAWRRIAGTTVTDPLFSFATLDYTLTPNDMPAELKQIAANSYYSPDGLSFRSGFQMAGRASVGGIMKTVLENGMGVPAQNFVMRAGVAIPTPTDANGQASLALGLLSDIKNLATNIKDLPEFYVELQTAPGAVITGPMGMSAVSLSDATFGMTNAGTVSYTGNLIIPGGKKFITFFQTPIAPSGALDLVDFQFGMAAQNFTMEDMAKLMIALNTPKVPGGNFLKDISGIQGPINQVLKPLSTIQMRNPKQVGEYRLGDRTKPFPTFDAFNLVVLGPLATFEDENGRKTQGPVLKAMGDARMFGQNMGSMSFFVGPSGLRARASTNVSIKLGPLGKTAVNMQSQTEINKDRQVMTFNGNVFGRKIDMRMTPTTLVIDSPATCATPFEISANINLADNMDLAAIFDNLPGANVDPEKLSGCVGEDLKKALNFINTNGKQLGGYAANQAADKLKNIADQEYRAAKELAREKAEQATHEAAQAFKSAGNFFKKAFGKKKKKKHEPKTDEIFAGSVFDWDFYYDNNPDVVKSGMDLADHWKRFGFNEGRQGSPEFSVRWYLAAHPDLQRAFGNDYRRALHHWLDNGIEEGRQGSPTFSVQAYRERYPDLQRAFGRNWEKLFDHWMEAGQDEGRSGAP